MILTIETWQGIILITRIQYMHIRQYLAYRFCSIPLCFWVSAINIGCHPPARLTPASYTPGWPQMEYRITRPIQHHDVVLFVIIRTKHVDAADVLNGHRRADCSTYLNHGARWHWRTAGCVEASRPTADQRHQRQTGTSTTLQPSSSFCYSTVLSLVACNIM